MGKKLYEKTEGGGLRFKSDRKPGEVRIPNYVYDLWLPLLGVTAIGVYNVYCRLERENIVKAITLQTLARICHIGKTRLYRINGWLEECGFIRITKPEGWKRLAHYTTEIEVLDPPKEVPADAIGKYATVKSEYIPMSPWLIEDEAQTVPSDVPNGTPGDTEGDIDDVPLGTPKVETLGLKPIEVETSKPPSFDPSSPRTSQPSTPRSSNEGLPWREAEEDG